MTFLVTDACIKCKLTDCVVVCPVDCFHEGELSLVIDPDECIDCGVCVPECPLDAIVPEREDVDGRWMSLNMTYAMIWPVLTVKRPPLPDWEQFEHETGKFERFFSGKAGAGD